MEKKNYQTPTCLVVELKPHKILMTSAEISGYSKQSTGAGFTEENVDTEY